MTNALHSMARNVSVKAVIGGLMVCMAAAYGADVPWVKESISTHATGSWTPMVLYNRSTGLAHMNGGEHTYTPNAPSSGAYVPLTVKAK